MCNRTQYFPDFFYAEIPLIIRVWINKRDYPVKITIIVIILSYISFAILSILVIKRDIHLVLNYCRRAYCGVSLPHKLCLFLLQVIILVCCFVAINDSIPFLDMLLLYMLDNMMTINIKQAPRVKNSLRFINISPIRYNDYESLHKLLLRSLLTS